MIKATSRLSVTNLKCGCFFSGRIFNPVCQEHKKPTDWQAIADNLLGKAKGEISVMKSGKGHSVLSSGLQPPTQLCCSNRPEG